MKIEETLLKKKYPTFTTDYFEVVFYEDRKEIEIFPSGTDYKYVMQSDGTLKALKL